MAKKDSRVGKVLYILNGIFYKSKAQNKHQIAAQSTYLCALRIIFKSKKTINLVAKV